MRSKLVVMSVLILIVAGFAGCIRDSADVPQEDPQVPNTGGSEEPAFDHPMQDGTVRQALSYAFPYVQVREQVYHGYMSPLSGPIPKGMPYHETQASAYEENLNRATEILDAAGYTMDPATGYRFGGEPLVLIYNEGNTQREQTSRLFAQNLALIGINAEVESLPWPQFLERFFQTRDWDFVFLGWQPDYNDPDNYWFPFAASGEIEGYPDLHGDKLRSGYSNPELDEILVKAKFETDPDARADLYRQAHDIYMQEPSLLLIGQGEDVHFYRDWVRGFVHNPLVVEPGYFHDMSKAEGAKNRERFVYATLGDPARLDPHDAYDSASGLVLQNVYDTLVRYEGDDTQNIVPRLATHWETSEDGLTWTFHLREGVKFADGSEMTAEDVAYSFDRIIRLGAPETGVSWIMEQYLEEGGVRAVDDNTVEFHLTTPYAGFLPTLAYTVGGIVSKDYCEANGGLPEKNEDGEIVEPGCEAFLNENPMGTNAWQVQRWDYGSEIVLVRNPHYWEGWSDDNVESVVIRNIEDGNTRINALLEGEVDFAARDLDRLDMARTDPRVVVSTGESFSVTFGVMNTYPEE